MSKNNISIEVMSNIVTNWMGTPWSILFHTFAFASIFSLLFLGFSLDQILLILTTALSIEAIYLALFIQMTVNRQTQAIGAVEVDIDTIGEDIGQIEENLDNIEGNIEEIQEDIEEEDTQEKQLLNLLKGISAKLDRLEVEVSDLKSVSPLHQSSLPNTASAGAQ